MWKWISNTFYKVRCNMILNLAGKMPVILNCTVYDDVVVYNFDNNHGLCYNNLIKNHVYTKARLRSGSYRKGNSVVLDHK